MVYGGGQHITPLVRPKTLYVYQTTIPGVLNLVSSLEQFIFPGARALKNTKVFIEIVNFYSCINSFTMRLKLNMVSH